MQLIEMLAETYVHFRVTKLPLGPLIILEKKLDFQHYLTLTTQEKLLAYHEIAHFLNGDLELDAGLQKLAADYKNLSYQREHYADLVGFALLLREEKYYGPVSEQDRYRILLALISLFKVQYDLQGPETKDYPHPFNRLLVIIECFYGKPTAAIIGDAIEKDRFHLLDVKKLTIENSRELQYEGYIEQQLRLRFKPK
jgi:hypothetical protein